ncbi:MAG: hypothetical protein JSS29_01975 [Proteobacteria bacterium]|nr:hypothetical protein [Pseudomonadota bacterium]
MRVDANSRDFSYRTTFRGLLVRAASALLGVVRFALFAVLGALEPFVRLVLVLMGFLGLTACVIYRLLLHDPRFPLATMLTLSVGFCVVAALYRALVQWLSDETG